MGSNVNKEIDVSIIYVNYKTCQLIIDSIHAVKEKTSYITYEIIVVENNSGDDSEAKITSAFPDVLYIQSPENVGFGRANNLGIEKASGKCILFMNPDTLLQNNAIKVLHDYLISNPKVGVCGGNLVDEELNPTSSFGRSFPSLMQELLAVFYLKPIFFTNVKSTYYNHTDKAMSVASIVGADMMMRRNVLDKIGAFDPIFFMNYEETELCYRVKKAGYAVHCIPTARIIHLEGKSEYISQSRMQLLQDGKYKYFKKVSGNTSAKCLYWIQHIKCRLRLMVFKVLGNNPKIAYWEQYLNVNKKAYSTV